MFAALGAMIAFVGAAIVIRGDADAPASTPLPAPAVLNFLFDCAELLLEISLLLRRLGGRRKDLGEDIPSARPTG